VKDGRKLIQSMKNGLSEFIKREGYTLYYIRYISKTLDAHNEILMLRHR